MTSAPPSPTLVLASSSPYRRALLERLRMPFETASPDIDESAGPEETARNLVTRLAKAKTLALAPAYPAHWIIGSDQVASLPGGRILTKPGNYETAVQQLSWCSGSQVDFLTGLAVLDSATGQIRVTCETFSVHFRELSPLQIDHYLRLEEPYDCAGSFKMEGLGIVLFEKMEGQDPNTLVGLPLIQLVSLLQEMGCDVLENAYRSSILD
ncbi:nucleoside triphosphate pyrophosphatase [Marinobacteraceae bacterium S3BR75-40.1]